MNTRILLLAVGVAALSSCSSVYKSGQTPDDVYFSPARPQAEYVQVDNRKDEDRYQSYEEYQDNYRNDRFLRLSISNRYYMGMYDDYAWLDWRYNTYAYNFNNPWNNYWSWNNFYNPYCGSIVYSNPKFSISRPVSRPVTFNSASYNSSKPARYSIGNGGIYYNNNNNQRYNNSNNSLGSSLQKMFSNSSNNSNSTPSSNSSTPTRSYTPSSSGSSSSGSSGGGGGGGVSRPGRGG